MALFCSSAQRSPTQSPDLNPTEIEHLCDFTNALPDERKKMFTFTLQNLVESPARRVEGGLMAKELEWDVIKAPVGIMHLNTFVHIVHLSLESHCQSIESGWLKALVKVPTVLACISCISNPQPCDK